MKIESMAEGEIVYTLRKHGMGNTTISTMSVLPVRICSVDLEQGRVLASVNNNTARWYRRCEAEKWRKSKPVMVQSAMGYQRLATREEIKALAAKSEESK